MNTRLRNLRGKERVRALVHAYLLAKQIIIATGHEDEITWQEDAKIDLVTDRVFFREAAWVILCAGMRETVVRNHFKRLGGAFEQWSPKNVVSRSESCRHRARLIYNHQRKIDAIIEIAQRLNKTGVAPIIKRLEHEGPRSLTDFAYIGNVSCFHLAKNLGYPVAKPDRHLQRIAAAWGFKEASGFCEVIADYLEEPIQIVDLVMWRFATIDRNYITTMEKFALNGCQSKN